MMKEKNPRRATGEGFGNHRGDDTRSHTPKVEKRQRLVGTLSPRWSEKAVRP